MMFFKEPPDSPMASADGEGDHDGGGDPLPLGVDPAAASGLSDGERDRTEASGGKRTTGAGGVSVIVKGDGDNTDSLGDDL